MYRHPDERVVTFPEPLIRGTIVRRANRFTIEVDRDGRIVPCHCPTTGRIGNLVLDGLPCLLSDSHSSTRKTRYTVEAIAVDTVAPAPMWIGINQNAANRYIEAALTSGALDRIVPVVTVQRERALGLSRLDFLVNGNTYVEVKTSLQTLQIALPAGTATRKQPPFNATDRMVKHITELGHSLADNQRAVMLLCFLYDNPGFQPEGSARHDEVAARVAAAIAQGVEIWQTNLLIDPRRLRRQHRANGLTLGEYLSEWLEVCRRRLRPKTFESYALCVQRIEVQLGRVALVRITPLMVQSAYARLEANGLASRTVFQTHAVLHRALDQALHWGLIKRNPTEVVAAPRPEQREMTALSTQQLAVLLASSRGSRWYPLWVLLGTAGLRIGEALGLRWGDVDLKTGRFRSSGLCRDSEVGAWSSLKPRRHGAGASSTCHPLRWKRSENSVDMRPESWSSPTGPEVLRSRAP